MTVEEIKNRFHIRDELASRGIEVNRQGFARCPLHSGDHTASFHVYDDQNTWHCFGCGKGGDVIDFVRLIDNLSFLDACRAISGEEMTRAGKYAIEQKKRQRIATERRKMKEKERLRTLNAEACKYWQYLMFDEPMSDEWTSDYNKWQLVTYKADMLTEQIYGA